MPLWKELLTIFCRRLGFALGVVGFLFWVYAFSIAFAY